MQPQRQNDPQMTEAQREVEHRRLRDRFIWLDRFTDDELAQITFCETGAEMLPGETYFDVSCPEQGTFVGQAGKLVPKGGCLIQQGSISPQIWNKLTAYPPRR